MRFLHAVTDALISYGPWGLLLLAFIDSAGIPVGAGMDAIVLLVAIKTPSRAWLGACLAVLGSAAGNLSLFLAARKGARWVKKEEEITPGDPSRLHRWFQRYGLATVFIPAVVPVVPLPLKAFVISAGAMRMKVAPFLAVVVLARVIRYFGEAWLGIQLGEGSMQFLKDHVALLTGIAAGMTVSLYLLLRLSGRRRRAE